MRDIRAAPQNPGDAVSAPLASLQTPSAESEQKEGPRTLHELLCLIEFLGENSKSSAGLG